MKTRAQLRAEGKELRGPIVPEWFVAQSDGCSVPGRIGKWLLKAKQSRAACYIHDFEYWLLAIQYPKHSGGYAGARMRADRRLRQNRALVARNKMIGLIYSRLYFRGVRFGGRYAMKDISELVVPPSIEDIDALEIHTKQGKRVLAKWRASLSI